MSYTQINALEQDAVQVLFRIRSLKNTFALVNKIPLDVLTMIPDHWNDSDRDQNLINLTHVCRGWREAFTLCPSLWGRLDCANVEKTRVYIERSRSSPLEVHIGGYSEDSLDLEDDISDLSEAALHLMVPHFGRLKILYVRTTSISVPPVFVEHFSRRFPVLEKLTIESVCHYLPPLPEELFDGDLSSLRELSLDGILPPVPRKGMPNLTTLTLRCMPKGKSLLTRLLNLFEYSPHIRYIRLSDLIPDSSEAPAERVVSLPYLQKLEIIAGPTHSTLLNHLLIPAGASLTLRFSLDDEESPISSYLSKSSDGLLNLSHITTVNLSFGPERRLLRLNGPSGELRVLEVWPRGQDRTNAGTSLFLRSLGRFDLSRSRWLVIQLCRVEPLSTDSAVECAIHQALNSLKDLYSLTLIHCKNLTFILALNPSTNSSTIVLCPELKEITLYIEDLGDLHVGEVLKMAEARASRGAKLSVITIISTATLGPKNDVFQLRKHVSRVECKFDDTPPEWDALPARLM